jgi:hypothetical protein
MTSFKCIWKQIEHGKFVRPVSKSTIRDCSVNSTGGRPRRVLFGGRETAEVEREEQVLQVIGVRRGVFKGVEDVAGHLPCGRATPETAIRPFQWWPACRVQKGQAWRSLVIL